MAGWSSGISTKMEVLFFNKVTERMVMGSWPREAGFLMENSGEP